MSDYGKALTFGVSLTPNASQYPELVKQVQFIEQLGADLIGIQDHPYNASFFDTWTLLTALVLQTTHVHFFPNVIDLPLRPPAVLAKAAASLDVISGGRIELGMGAGWRWDEIAAMGGAVRSGKVAVDALEEAIQVIQLAWSGAAAGTFTGTYYHLHEKVGPQPAHHIGIWIGALGPRMLSLTGRRADGWSASLRLSIKDLPESQRRIDEAAQQAGRSPLAIRRLFPLPGRITRGEVRGALDGPVTRWIETVSALALDGGIDTFILWPQGNPIEQTEIFAQEVMPAVRAIVAQQRKQ